MGKYRFTVLWTVLAVAVLVPIAAAALSPLLAWRDPVYIVAGFAGVLAMALMLFQPLLASGYLTGIPEGRRAHRWIGSGLVLLVITHVLGLWITSPPDVIDALLFASPTPFSVWGVIAMWGVFVTAFIAGFRRRLRLHPRIWRRSHKSLAAVIVAGSVVHAMLIEGTMETISKAILCVLVIAATAVALLTFPRK